MVPTAMGHRNWIAPTSARFAGIGRLRRVDPAVTISTSDAVLARWLDPFEPLTDTERLRAAQFRNSRDANDFVAAHLLIRECVGRLLGTAPKKITIEQKCQRCGGPHGKPIVAGELGIKPSWSHCTGRVAATACDRAIGIDIENRTSTPVDERLLVRVATRTESITVLEDADPAGALLRLWVMKESLVKAGALGLDDFASVALDDVTGFELLVLDQAAHPGLVAGMAIAFKPQPALCRTRLN